ncbi:hypothetical protein EV401DRAFT_1884015 [Pisolithus croceorrhizus]|nr:hypothetical protein EV401DRAFT_1884015 [Pisolithus croceorrhizus]
MVLPLLLLPLLLLHSHGLKVLPPLSLLLPLLHSHFLNLLPLLSLPLLLLHSHVLNVLPLLPLPLLLLHSHVLNMLPLLPLPLLLLHSHGLQVSPLLSLLLLLLHSHGLQPEDVEHAAAEPADVSTALPHVAVRWRGSMRWARVVEQEEQNFDNMGEGRLSSGVAEGQGATLEAEVVGEGVALEHEPDTTYDQSHICCRHGHNLQSKEEQGVIDNGMEESQGCVGHIQPDDQHCGQAVTGHKGWVAVKGMKDAQRSHLVPVVDPTDWNSTNDRAKSKKPKTD